MIGGVGKDGEGWVIIVFIFEIICKILFKKDKKDNEGNE